MVNFVFFKGAGVHSTIWVSLLKNMKDELVAQVSFLFC